MIPVALGLISNEHLEHIHRIELLRNEVRRLEADEKERRLARDTWRPDAAVQYARAQELGLLARGEVPTDVNAIIAALRNVVRDGGQTISGARDMTAGVVNRLANLTELERSLDRDIADARRRLRRLKGLRESFAGYRSVLVEQEARVESLGWFKKAIKGDSECPLCGSVNSAALQSLAALDEPLAELEDLAAATKSARPSLDKEIISIERTLSDKEQAILTTRRERQQLEGARGTEGGLRLEDVYKLLGAVDQALRLVAGPTSDDIAARLATKRSALRDLAALVDERALKASEDEALAKIGDWAASFAERLGASADGTPILDRKELNLKFVVQNSDRPPDYLWEIGSGANWMAYHVAFALAFQRWCWLKNNSPVPGFLIIDQPSQVYFPSDTYQRRIEEAEGGPPRVIGAGREDFARTIKIFETLDHAARLFGDDLQIIVLEHADKKAWGDLETFNEAGNWRTEDWLIPTSWLPNESTPTG